MSAGYYNIIIECNSDWARTFQIKTDGLVLDLTDHSLRMSVKSHGSSANSIDATVVVNDAANGVVSFSIPKETTTTMKPGDWSYDILLVKPNGDVMRLLQGDARVSGGITV